MLLFAYILLAAGTLHGATPSPCPQRLPASLAECAGRLEGASQPAARPVVMAPRDHGVVVLSQPSRVHPRARN